MQLESGSAGLLRAGVPTVLGGRNLASSPGQPVSLRVMGQTIPITVAPVFSESGADGRGEDQMTVTAPASLTSTVTGDAVITSAGGTITMPYWVLAKHTVVNSIEKVFGTPAPVNALYLNTRYRLTGTDLGYVRSGGQMLSSRPLLAGANGSLQQMNIASTTPTTLEFSTPPSASFTSATLRLATWTGDTLTIGTFPIQNPTAPVPPPLQTFIVSPSPAPGGTTLNATIGFAGTLPAGSDVGDLVISASPPLPGMPKTVPITANPMVIGIPTRADTVARTLAIKARLSRSTGTTDSLSAAAQLNAVRLLSFASARDTVSGGKVVELRAQFDAPAFNTTNCTQVGNDGKLMLRVVSSDTAVAVPASQFGVAGERICIDRNDVPVMVLTKQQSAERAVTLTASISGASVPFTLRVLPPTVLAVRTRSGFLTALQRDTIEVVLSGSLPGSAISLTSQDPALVMPTQLSGPSLQYHHFPVISSGVEAKRSVAVSATTAGGTRTFTLNLLPNTFQNFSLTPAAAPAGSNVAASLSLSAAPSVPVTVALTSSDPTVATVPATVQFLSGQNAIVFNVQTTSHQTQQRSVTITATYVSPSGNRDRFSRSVTLTVVP